MLLVIKGNLPSMSDVQAGTGQRPALFWPDWLWKMLNVTHTSNLLTSSSVINIAMCTVWHMTETELVDISFLLFSYATGYAVVIKKLWCIRCVSMKLSTNEIMHEKMDNFQKPFLGIKKKALLWNYINRLHKDIDV